MEIAESSPNRLKTLWEKEKLLVMSNFSFSRSVFKRPVLQTRKNQGLFGKGLSVHIHRNRTEPTNRHVTANNRHAKDHKLKFKSQQTESLGRIVLGFVKQLINRGKKNVSTQDSLQRLNRLTNFNTSWRFIEFLFHRLWLHGLDASKLKEFADDNFKFDAINRKFSKWVENTVRKGEIATHK